MKSLIPKRLVHRDTTNTPTLFHSPFGMDHGQLFDRFFQDVWGGRSEETLAMTSGAMDVVEMEDALRISVEVPGIDPAELEVSLTGRVLTLSAEKRDEHVEESENRTYSERRFGTFRRSIKLPCDVDPGGVQAQHKHGVVTVTLKKSDAVRPKRIEVDIA